MLDDAILRLPAVKAAVGLSKTTIYQRIKDRTFPEPVPIDGDRVGWPESAIQAWIAAKKAGIPWQPPAEMPAPAQLQAAPKRPPPVDRAEVVKGRIKKPRKPKAEPAFQLTADALLPPAKPAHKPATRRTRSSQNEAVKHAMQCEFPFD
jgi:prophage regulatory protein